MMTSGTRVIKIICENSDKQIKNREGCSRWGCALSVLLVGWFSKKPVPKVAETQNDERSDQNKERETGETDEQAPETVHILFEFVFRREVDNDKERDDQAKSCRDAENQTADFHGLGTVERPKHKRGRAAVESGESQSQGEKNRVRAPVRDRTHFPYPPILSPWDRSMPVRRRR